MSFNTVYVGNNRLFPTQFLATTFGIVNFISHVFAVGAPLIAELSDPFPFTVFLVNCLVALLSACFLKEIHHHHNDNSENIDNTSRELTKVGDNNV